jgi:hypothetical protein
MDQMCLSIQFFMLGALHASGIVMAVLGYMLVLHESHNVFGDPMILPIFSSALFVFSFGKRIVMRIADRLQIWMVEGEREHEEIYDEGPGSRNQGALPPGTEAVDAVLAECIEDAFAVGYTEDSLAKVLQEVALNVPPGAPIQAVSTRAATDFSTGDVRAQELPPSMALREGCLTKGLLSEGFQSLSLDMTSGPSHCMGCSGFMNMNMNMNTDMNMNMNMNPLAMSALMAPPKAQIDHFPRTSYPTPFVGDEVSGQQIKVRAGDDDHGFKEFLTAFRTEMSYARDLGMRKQRFVHSSKLKTDPQPQAPSTFDDVTFSDHDPGADSFDEWPDEFLLLGVAAEDSAPLLESTPESSTTSDTGSTYETSDSNDDDVWPVELLIG